MSRGKIVVRLLGVVGVALIALGSYQLYWYEAPPPAVAPPDFQPSADALPTNEQFAELCRTDVLAALEVSLTRYAREVKGYRATLHKRERLGGVLHPPEVVRVAIAHDPLRVRMNWDAGARLDRLGKATEGALFVAGRNGNETTAWRPNGFLKTVSVGVKDSDARRAARYTIVESAFDKSMLRTLVAWREAQKRGDPKAVWVRTAVEEVAGGRLCHVVRRTCPVPEVDSFALDEQPSRDATKIKNDGHSEVTIWLDAETWLQVGSELKRADGEPTASYHFRDVQLNPPFPPNTFTVEALKRKP